MMQTNLSFPSVSVSFFTAKDEESGEILPFTRYRITTGEGKVFEGRTDAEGKTVAVYTALPDALHIELL